MFCLPLLITPRKIVVRYRSRKYPRNAAAANQMADLTEFYSLQTAPIVLHGALLIFGNQSINCLSMVRNWILCRHPYSAFCLRCGFLSLARVVGACDVGVTSIFSPRICPIARPTAMLAPCFNLSYQL